MKRFSETSAFSATPERKPYKNASIQSLRIDPHALWLGQKYVYRPTYISIMEKFKDIFNGFTVSKGISKLTPYIVIGYDDDGQIVPANYLPPIFEVHSGKMVILDGVHRDFIVKNAGTTIQSIVIDDISEPFPCVPHPWDKIRVVDDKPPELADRYFDLDKDMFRDLNSIGIDG